MGIAIKNAYVALVIVVMAGVAVAQPIPSDELHTQTAPYVPPSTVTLRTQVELVEVPVVVRDGKRRAVGDLTRDDFEVYDGGKKQTITSFSVQHFTPQTDAGGGTPVAAGTPSESRDAPRPRLIALLFDTLNIDNAALKPAKDAAERFVRNSLAPGDRVVVVTTGMTAETEFSADVPKLVAQIAKITSQQRLTDSGGAQCPRIRPFEAYLIVNHIDNDVLQAKVAEYRACAGPRAPNPEAVVNGIAQGIWEYARANSMSTLRVIDALVSGMAKAPGQRMILLTSSGFLTGNLEADEEALMTKALHAEVVINTLDAKGLYVAIPGGDVSEPRPVGRVPARAQITNMQTQAREPEAKNDGLASLAAGTGGTFYHNNNDLASGFRQLGMVPETIYVLGFAPSDTVADGRFHSLKVKLGPGKHYTLQARLGYTAPSANAAAQVSAPSKLDTEAMAADTIAELPATMSWEQRGTSEITLTVHLEISRLHFENRQDRRSQKLTIVAVLLDSRGGFVTGKRSVIALDLTDLTLAKLTAAGMTNLAMTLAAPPGSYSARAVVQEGTEGKMAAAGAMVQVK
jgi:VWFA-related protein